MESKIVSKVQVFLKQGPLSVHGSLQNGLNVEMSMEMLLFKMYVNYFKW